jgi:serine/threonine protein kinase/Tol biopolymer transport system component
MRLAPGTNLDGYEVIGPLGAGGMGEVYRARDSILKRDIAIKVLPSSVSQDPERLRRFEQEAQAAASLNHPNILAVYRFGVFEGAPYLVSELLEGNTLRQQMERGPLPVRKAIDLGVQIALGLAAAHEKGIVHRDLKPENLFLAKDGQVKILDFGLAKWIQPSTAPEMERRTITHVTEPGVVIGTVGYMSPEQVRGSPADHRADLFAFGAILYEMLTGKRAFHRSTQADTMSAILNEDPAGFSQVTQVTPPGLQRVVHRCLEKNPEQRFQSASDLAFALDALSGSGASLGTAISPPDRHKTRRPMVWGGAGSVALLAFLAGAYLLYWRAKPLPFAHYSIQRVTDNKHVLVTAISPDGAYLAMVIRTANGNQDLLMQHIATGSERPILQNSGYDYQDLIFSPDGNFVYFRVQQSTERYEVYRLAVLGGQPARILQDVDAPLSFLAGGKRLCFYRQNDRNGTYQFLSTAADGSDQQVLASGKKPFLEDPACSPDGRFAVYQNDHRELKSVEFASGVQRDLPLSEYQTFEKRWAPDGRGLFLITFPGNQIRYLSYPGGKLRQITNDLSHYSGLSITGDGRTIASSIYSRNARFAEFPLADPSRLTEQETGTMYWFDYLDDDKIVESDVGVAPKTVDLKKKETVNVNAGNMRFFFSFSPCGAGALVVSGRAESNATNATNVYRVNLDGSAPIKLTQGSADAFPQCTADGKWLFYVDNSIPSNPYLMRQPLRGGTAQRVMACSVWYDLSPDGKSLANITWEAVSRLQIISTDSLQEISSFYVPQDVHPEITFATDGKSIFYFTGPGFSETIWRQPLVGKANAVKVVSLPGKQVHWIRPSPGGKKLGLTLATPSSEAVIIRATQ